MATNKITSQIPVCFIQGYEVKDKWNHDYFFWKKIFPMSKHKTNGCCPSLDRPWTQKYIITRSEARRINFEVHIGVF